MIFAPGSIASMRFATGLGLAGLGIVGLLGLAACGQPLAYEVVAVAPADEGVFITERSDSGRESIWRLHDDGRIAECGSPGAVALSRRLAG